jgi:hypothetical protein
MSPCGVDTLADPDRIVGSNARSLIRIRPGRAERVSDIDHTDCDVALFLENDRCSRPLEFETFNSRTTIVASPSQSQVPLLIVPNKTSVYSGHEPEFSVLRNWTDARQLIERHYLNPLMQLKALAGRGNNVQMIQLQICQSRVH